MKRVRGRTRASTTTTEQPERSEQPTRQRSSSIRTRAPYTRNTNRGESTRDRASDNASNEETVTKVSHSMTANFELI